MKIRQTAKPGLIGPDKARWKWRMVPVTVLVSAIVLSAITMRSPTLKWNGLSLIEPFRADKVYQDNDMIVYESQSRVEVRAGTDGKIASKSNGRVDIQTSEATVIVRYSGLSSISDSVKTGQNVARGQVIGVIEPRHNPLAATMGMQLIRNGDAVQPPKDIPILFSKGLGQKIYANDCTGCHELRNVIPLNGGTMRSGEHATEALVSKKIRVGGKGLNELVMPPFEHALTDAEMEAVIAYVCAQRCEATTAQTLPPNR